MIAIQCDLWRARKIEKKQNYRHKERVNLKRWVAAGKENVHDLKVMVSQVVNQRESLTWHACGCGSDLE